MPHDNRDVERCLINKFGFTRSQTRADDHRWVEITFPGLPVIATKFSHSREDIGRVLWSKIAKQLRVRTAFLEGMIDCHNGPDDYEHQIRNDPFPPFNVGF